MGGNLLFSFVLIYFDLFSLYSHSYFYFFICCFYNIFLKKCLFFRTIFKLRRFNLNKIIIKFKTFVFLQILLFNCVFISYIYIYIYSGLIKIIASKERVTLTALSILSYRDTLFFILNCLEFQKAHHSILFLRYGLYVLFSHKHQP